MNFLIDEQLPPGLCHWLAEIGHAATHVNDLGLSDGEDETIWNHALRIDAIIRDNNYERRRFCRKNRTHGHRPRDPLASHRQLDQSSFTAMARTALERDHGAAGS
ncbi:MAG: DUF5615 family PIN-like protein [Pyrinomonadaceae bacterium]|nr:DUF5615 family PIN-like protein [Pyrinomonadaceae bacterium]MBP9110994.1 DUF5615 family PIN-like protein [Pyrinomonadaceae bacterium]